MIKTASVQGAVFLLVRLIRFFSVDGKSTVIVIIL